MNVDDRVEKAKLVVEPKIDCLSIVLRYRDSVSLQGAMGGELLLGEHSYGHIWK